MIELRSTTLQPPFRQASPPPSVDEPVEWVVRYLDGGMETAQRQGVAVATDTWIDVTIKATHLQFNGEVFEAVDATFGRDINTVIMIPGHRFISAIRKDALTDADPA